jgi:hypothetical protein
MPLTRRRVLALAAAAAPGGIVPHTAAGGRTVSDPLAGDALYADIVDYCAFGDHRTASDADIATSEWLAGRYRDAGLVVERKAFMVRQFFATRELLAIAGTPVDAYPLWFPRAGRARGPLRNDDGPDLDGAIARIRLDRASAAEARMRIDAAVELGARGAVVEAPLPSGEPYAFNAGAVLPVPVMLAGTRDRERLDAAVRDGGEAVIELDGSPRSTQAYEVIGSFASAPGDQDAGARDGGRQDAGRHIVVSTPYSAWTAAAGERGPGIAIQLALARAVVARADPRCRYTFVASSGHELDGAGIRHFVEHLAPPPASTHAWIHLGASIAVHDYAHTPGGYVRLPQASRASRCVTNDDALFGVFASTLAGIAHLAPARAATARGEVQLFFERGYRAVGFEGSHPHFHSRRDLPEVAVSPALLEPVARAIAAALERIEALPGA